MLLFCQETLFSNWYSRKYLTQKIDFLEGPQVLSKLGIQTNWGFESRNFRIFTGRSVNQSKTEYGIRVRRSCIYSWWLVLSSSPSSSHLLPSNLLIPFYWLLMWLWLFSPEYSSEIAKSSLERQSIAKFWKDGCNRSISKKIELMFHFLASHPI